MKELELVKRELYICLVMQQQQQQTPTPNKRKGKFKIKALKKEPGQNISSPSGKIILFLV